MDKSEFDLEYEMAKDCYRNGKYNEAIKFLLNPAQNGCFDAANDLGACYERVGDFEKAAFWYSVAAINKKETPNLNVADLFLAGKGLKQDIKLALKIYLDYARQGSESAYEKLADAYLKGKYVRQDYKKAYSYLLKGAKIERDKKISAYCLGNLGYMNQEGLGKAKNIMQAFKYYKEAAKYGNEVAQYNLARCYLYAWGCQMDIEKAVYWFYQSAEQNHHNSLIYLSELYSDGRFFRKNNDIAMYWIERAIDQNVPEAFIKCADYYLGGEIVHQNKFEAYKLLSYYQKYLKDKDTRVERLYDELKIKYDDQKFWSRVESNKKGALA